MDKLLFSWDLQKFIEKLCKSGITPHVLDFNRCVTNTFFNIGYDTKFLHEVYNPMYRENIRKAFSKDKYYKKSNLSLKAQIHFVTYLFSILEQEGRMPESVDSTIYDPISGSYVEVKELT